MGETFDFFKDIICIQIAKVIIMEGRQACPPRHVWNIGDGAKGQIA